MAIIVAVIVVVVVAITGCIDMRDSSTETDFKCFFRSFELTSELAIDFT